MLASISATFGLSIDESSQVAWLLAGTLAGRATVSGLLKLIPGIGSIAGGVIAATTAAALTTAFGEAYLRWKCCLFTITVSHPHLKRFVLQEEVLATCCRKIKLLIQPAS